MNADRFYIGGSWVEPAGGETTDVVNPATGEAFARAAVPSPADAERAIDAARDAFDTGPWPRMTPKERADALRRVREILHGRNRELGDLLRQQVGATLMLIKGPQLSQGIEAFECAADWTEAVPWEEPVEPRTKGIRVDSIAIREPVGVLTAMTPFNFPFLTNAWKVAPAIAMGNTVVLKPSPWTPLDAFEIARACEEAEIPPGVVNVIGGGGIDVGQVLASHPKVDMVSFTGSVAGGRAVGASAMQTVKKMQLELGGKSVALVLDDADPADVAMRMMGTCMLHAGQGCGCTTRMLVPRSKHDAFVDAVVAACESLSVGDPIDPGVWMGPLIREQHRERVNGYVRAGVEEGATLATGGKIPEALPRGFFYEPTVFTGVDNRMRIAQEEIFGPVLAVIPYATEDEAVGIANDSIYGLGGAVMSPDRARALDVARRLRTGFVGLNGGMQNFNGSWGGYRQSGVGREWRLGLEEFTELKHITWTDL